MLPFIPEKKSAGIAQATYSAEDSKVETDQGVDPGLEEAAQAMIRAINMKDPKALAMAIQDAYEICESYEDDEDYSESEAE